MTQRERQILQLIEKDPMISQQELADRLGITRSSVAVHISNLQKKGCIAGKGYVIRSGTYAVVVGGVNVDIGGRSFRPLVAEDSNPGQVSLSLGGVGRNIAHNLALLGADVRMLTAYGDDAYGQQVADSFCQLGIDASCALRLSQQRTSTYLYIADEQGEMRLAVSDMEICRQITPAYLAQHLSLLQNARVVVADTNLPAETLAYLAQNCSAPLFCDPVSTAKAEKLRPILSRIHTLKPNALEAQLLSGVSIESPDDARRAAEKLLELGVQRVFISMGSQGVVAAEKGQTLFVKNLPGSCLNTTGCGDAFMAALVWAWLEELSLADAALAGAAAGAITMESPATIHPTMSAQALKNRMLTKEVKE